MQRRLVERRKTPGRFSPSPHKVRLKSGKRSRKEEEFVGRRRNTGREDRQEGAMDKAKGRVKEATGALAGDKDKKAEGRADQRSGTLKEKKGHLKDLLK